jgi:hypothetical protein
VSLKIRGWALVTFKVYGMEFKAWVYEWSVKVWVVVFTVQGSRIQGFFLFTCSSEESKN